MNTQSKSSKILKYTKAISKVNFEEIKDHCCFYSSGVLYLKLLQQDLKFFGIDNVNAVSVLNGGLTFFESDEKVIEAYREIQ